MRGVGPSAWAGAATLAAPALRRMLRGRVARGKEVAERLGEREGLDATPRPPGRLVWLHAASVGESVSVLPVLAALGRTPGVAVLMTTGTVTAASLLRERLPALGLDRVLHRFVPLDVPRWAARFLDHWRPDVAVFVESELWPNLLRGCEARGIPALLVNARMSERSFRAWRWAPRFARSVLGAFARIHPQSEADAARLRALGAERLEPVGNIKLAAPPLQADEAELARLRGIIGSRPVWLASSTHEGEEAAAVAAHHCLAPQHPGLLTMLAPRHPDRGEALARQFGASQRSRGEDPGCGGVWIADTLGELGLLFRLAVPVFVGGSLVPMGGHNPLEPARLGCTLAMGPHTGNCADAVRLLQGAGILRIVPDQESLSTWLSEALRDGPRRSAPPGILASGDALAERIAASILGTMRA